MTKGANRKMNQNHEERKIGVCVCVCMCAHECAGPCALAGRVFAGNRESKQVGRGWSSGPPGHWLGRSRTQIQESGWRGLNPSSTAYERASVSPSVKG